MKSVRFIVLLDVGQNGGVRGILSNEIRNGDAEKGPPFKTIILKMKNIHEVKNTMTNWN